MFGSRTKEHRSNMPFWHWMVLVGVMAGVVALGATLTKASEVSVDPHLERGELGYIAGGTHLCQTDAINDGSIKILEQWAGLITRLEAVDGDASLLSQEDNILGGNLMAWCGTTAEGYDVRHYKSRGNYALIVFLNGYGFDPLFYIIREESFSRQGWN